jgi:hypothetical protein
MWVHVIRSQACVEQSQMCNAVQSHTCVEQGVIKVQHQHQPLLGLQALQTHFCDACCLMSSDLKHSTAWAQSEGTAQRTAVQDSAALDAETH